MIINLLVKGFVIGMAKILPGVSGSLIALNMGLYEKGIEAISKFFTDVKNNLHFLINVGIGIILGIIFGSKLIAYFLNVNYFLTMCCFLGLLVGSNIYTVFNTKKYTKVSFIIFLITLILFVYKPNFVYVYHNNLVNNIFVILLGYIDAASMIIPCLSGTTIFMLLGSYEFVLKIFMKSCSFHGLLFILGLVFGIITISKMVNTLLNKNKEFFSSLIAGLFLSSIVYLSLENINHCGSFIQFLIGFIIFINSFFFSLIFSHKM